MTESESNKTFGAGFGIGIDLSYETFVPRQLPDQLVEGLSDRGITNLYLETNRIGVGVQSCKVIASYETFEIASYNVDNWDTALRGFSSQVEGYDIPPVAVTVVATDERDKGPTGPRATAHRDALVGYHVELRL